MRIGDLLGTAVRNTFRSKLRTSLTVIAIFIGAFTLTITSAIGAGISSYIDSQLGAIGAKGVLTVTHAPEDGLASDDGPVGKAYGVKKNLWGFERVTFLVGRDGKVAHVWPSVDPGVHADDVLAEAQKLP